MCLPAKATYLLAVYRLEGARAESGSESALAAMLQYLAAQGFASGGMQRVVAAMSNAVSEKALHAYGDTRPPRWRLGSGSLTTGVSCAVALGGESTPLHERLAVDLIGETCALGIGVRRHAACGSGKLCSRHELVRHTAGEYMQMLVAQLPHLQARDEALLFSALRSFPPSTLAQWSLPVLSTALNVIDSLLRFVDPDESMVRRPGAARRASR